MARHYVLGSWANADEFDYSGEQLMGHRQGKSVCMDHMLPSGMANLKRYGDPVEGKPKAPTKTKSVLNSILLADRNYERLCGLSEQLDQELDAGQIDLESWAAARKNIDQRLAKAWSRVQRERGWEGQEELLALEQYPSQPLDFTLDLEASRELSVDLSIIPKESIFSNLSDGNSFKIFYAHVLTGYKAVSKLLNNGKEILKEGLV